MADPTRNPHARDDTGVEPGRGATIGTSRWQKVVGIIGLVVVLWVGYQMFVAGPGLGGGGGPGPGQHAPPAEIEEQETDTDDGEHAPPP
jgi:hypothetical protein